MEGVADWYTLPWNNKGIGEDNTVTSSRLLELMGYKGQVLNSVNYMGTRQDNNYQTTSAGGLVGFSRRNSKETIRMGMAAELYGPQTQVQRPPPWGYRRCPW